MKDLPPIPNLPIPGNFSSRYTQALAGAKLLFQQILGNDSFGSIPTIAKNLACKVLQYWFFEFRLDSNEYKALKLLKDRSDNSRRSKPIKAEPVEETVALTVRFLASSSNFSLSSPNPPTDCLSSNDA